MTLSPENEVYRVLVGVAPARLPALTAAAVRNAHRIVRLDLARVQDRTQLCERCATVFEFPVMVDDMDAVISLAADLSWWPPQLGYLLVVDGLDDAPPSVVVDAARMFPSIVDRWRSQETPFTVVLVCPERLRAAALAGLAEANDRLAAHGMLPWAHPGTGPVAVLEGASAQVD